MDINTEKLSQVAEIVIGITAIYSLYLSRKALKKSDWNSALATVPSLVIRPRSIIIWRKDSPLDHGSVGVSQNTSIGPIKNDKRKFIFHILFECFNEGKGAAFNIKKPKVIGEADYEDWHNKTPLHQTLSDEPFLFSVKITKSFDEWKQILNKKIPVLVEITYTNNQGNVSCTSSWKAEIQPFKLEDSSLLAKEERLFRRDSSVVYTPVK